MCAWPATVPHIHKYIASTVRLFTDNCITYMKILNCNDLENLQIDQNMLGEWAFENEMIINTTKSKVICFTKALVTKPLNYSLRDSNM
jgi:hypothetical protein